MGPAAPLASQGSGAPQPGPAPWERPLGFWVLLGDGPASGQGEVEHRTARVLCALPTSTACRLLGPFLGVRNGGSLPSPSPGFPTFHPSSLPPLLFCHMGPGDTLWLSEAKDLGSLSPDAPSGGPGQQSVARPRAWAAGAGPRAGLVFPEC